MRFFTFSWLILIVAVHVTIPAPVEATPRRSGGVLVVDFGLPRFGEDAMRTRTLIQVLRPGIAARVLHYRQVTPQRLARENPRAVVIVAPPASLRRYPTEALSALESAVRGFRGPLLAIGTGCHLLVHAWEGHVGPIETEEPFSGTHDVLLIQRDPLFEGLPKKFAAVFQSHDEIQDVPEEFVRLAVTEGDRVVGLRHSRRDHYGVQFHPEAPLGARLPARQVLCNFLAIAGYPPSTPQAR